MISSNCLPMASRINNSKVGKKGKRIDYLYRHRYCIAISISGRPIVGLSSRTKCLRNHLHVSSWRYLSQSISFYRSLFITRFSAGVLAPPPPLCKVRCLDGSGQMDLHPHYTADSAASLSVWIMSGAISRFIHSRLARHPLPTTSTSSTIPESSIASRLSIE